MYMRKYRVRFLWFTEQGAESRQLEFTSIWTDKKKIKHLAFGHVASSGATEGTISDGFKITEIAMISEGKIA